jgi:hypothetical protein
MHIPSVPRRREGAIEADDIEIAILNPDSSHETAFAGVLFGIYVDYDAAQIA